MAENETLDCYEKGNLVLNWSVVEGLDLEQVDTKKLNQYLTHLTDAFYNFIIEHELIDETFETEFSVQLCDNVTIQNLNKDYREKDKITDVLSFALYENLRGGEEDVFGMAELGDIYICLDVAIDQGKEFNITTEEEIIHLLTHGFLHLLGYDHEISQTEEDLMFGFEEDILKSLSIQLKA